MDITLGSAGAAVVYLASKRPIIPFPDPLSHGPVQSLPRDSTEDWVTRRTGFWAELHGDGDAAARQRTYLQYIDLILKSDVLTLWLASDVDGLLLAAWLVSLVDAHKTDCRIELIQFARRWGPSLAGMPPDLFKTPPRSRLVVGAEADFLISLWQAWAAPTPKLLMELSERAPRQHSWRFLLERLLDRYPSAETGLSVCDEVLLRTIRRDGPRLSMVLGAALAKCWLTFDYVGDGLLRARLSRLARGGNLGPLVTIEPDEERPRQEKIALTELGADVLAGRVNALDLRLEFDWIGGVRVDSSRANVWVRTSDGLALRG